MSRPVWKEYNKVKSPDSKGALVWKGQCLICNEIISRSLTALANHINGCTSSSRRYDMKGHRCDAAATNNGDVSHERSTSPMTDSTGSSVGMTGVLAATEPMGAVRETMQTLERLKKQSTLEQCVKWSMNMDPKKKEAAHDLLGLFMIDKHLPFRAFESPWFRMFVSLLNPSYIMPGRDSFKRVVFPRLKAAVQKEMDKDIARHTAATLGIDGSSDKQESMINLLALVPSGPWQICSFRPGSEKEGGHYYLKKLKRGKLYVVARGTHCNGMMSDSCNTMRLCARLWVAETGLCAPLCGTHAYSNVLKKYFKFPEVASFLLQFNFVNNALNRGKLRTFVGEYKRDEKLELKMAKQHPKLVQGTAEYEAQYQKYLKAFNQRFGAHYANKTRQWLGTFGNVVALLRNHRFITKLVSEGETPKTTSYLQRENSDDLSLMDIIEDISFWRKSCRVVLKAAPLAKEITRLQADDANLADVFFSVESLRGIYTQNESVLADIEHQLELGDERVTEAIELYWDRVRDPAHCACALLDARFSNCRLDSESIAIGIKYIRRQFGDAAWSAWGEAMFTEYRQTQDDPNSWWANALTPAHRMPDVVLWLKTRTNVSDKAKEGVFANNTICIISVIGHNSGVERSFNANKDFQTKKRGSLGPISLDDSSFIGNNMKWHPLIFNKYFGVPEELCVKRKYTKKDKEYWESIEKLPIEQLCEELLVHLEEVERGLQQQGRSNQISPLMSDVDFDSCSDSVEMSE